MTRLAALALLCLACNASSGDPSLVRFDGDRGGSAGEVATGGDAGSGVTTGGASPEGGMGGAGAPTGGVFATGGTATGGVFSTGGSSTGGTFPTGGAQATGGAFPTGGSATGGTAPTGGVGGSSGAAPGGAGMGGRMLWSREFTHTGTISAGTHARHGLRILRRSPDESPADLCITLGGGDVPHGMTGTITEGYGMLLRNCLSAVPQTSPSRHGFRITALDGSSAGLVVGGSSFELPEDSRMWLARTVVRRITQNDWSAGAVTIRETWEFWE